ncbi:MAG: cell wall hydrolase [Sphingomonadales bacterium]|nr:MAG: cell wall hydrolase [Sphingomonadales bacterium]
MAKYYRSTRLALALVLAATGLLFAGLIALAYWSFAVPSDTAAQDPGNQAASAPGASDIPVPAVEPVRYLDITQEEARKVNAAVPFSKRPNPAASPFRPTMIVADSARATDCLAAAAWYEAGNDPVGAQSVVQVVLNRVRHPAFPNTVCGVVFQGSERSTGCQFSFTCDGALARTPSPAAWAAARYAAIAGLNGLVFKSVGWSTHYHTDWVVPYWSTSVDKTAIVKTHIFFRWRGTPGDPRAFSSIYRGGEPLIPKMAGLSEAHRAPGEAPPLENATEAMPAVETPEAAPAAPVSEAALRGNALSSRNAATNSFAIVVPEDAFAGAPAMTALDLCRVSASAPCAVYGARQGSPPIVIGATGKPSSGRVAFYYFRDKSRGREFVLWDCTVWKRPDPKQCLTDRLPN